MINSSVLKVLVLADKRTLSRIKNWRINREISVSGIISARDAVQLLNIERFDVVMIDSRFKDAAIACELIYETMSIPIALLVRDHYVDWRSLSNWKVDGFIKDRTDPAEAAARLRALSRRNTYYYDKCVYVAG